MSHPQDRTGLLDLDITAGARQCLQRQGLGGRILGPRGGGLTSGPGASPCPMVLEMEGPRCLQPQRLIPGHDGKAVSIILLELFAERQGRLACIYRGPDWDSQIGILLERGLPAPYRAGKMCEVGQEWVLESSVPIIPQGDASTQLQLLLVGKQAPWCQIYFMIERFL